MENGLSVYIVTDHLNAPIIGLSQTGSQIWSASCDPFGQATIKGNYQINLRADGQYQDDETGLYYNWYRYYSPELGRYITSDSLGLAAGMNTYIYVNGNPINFTDQMGLRADGITSGGSIEYMMPYFGFAVNGSVSIGWYRDRNGNNNHLGITASGGVNIRVGNYIFQYPEQAKGQENSLHNPNGFSGLAGISGGYFNSNAECVEQMRGPSQNYNINPPGVFNDYLYKLKLGNKNIPLVPSFQRSISGSIITDSITFSPKKYSFGSGASAYSTNTIIIYDGSK